MVFPNVKVREHKEAQLDLIRCIVHLTVDDKNVRKNCGWGSNSDQSLKAAQGQRQDAGAANIM